MRARQGVNQNCVIRIKQSLERKSVSLTLGVSCGIVLFNNIGETCG